MNNATATCLSVLLINLINRKQENLLKFGK